MNELDENLPVAQDPGDAALKDMAAELGIDVTALLAEAAVPFSGIAVRGVLGLFKNTYNQYAQGKINKVFADYMDLLRQNISRIDDELTRKATWEYVTRPENIIEIQRMLQSAVLASEREKISAALNNGVNVALAAGTDDRDIREFTAAFIRDCTGMDIRALQALPEDGTYTVSGENSDALNDEIREHIRNQVRTSNAAEEALLWASMRKLHGLGLCFGFATFGGGFNPVQRTALGAEVYRRLVLEADTPVASDE